MNIKLIVATHKPYRMPWDTSLYLPVHAGHYGKKDIGYQGDDGGDNISDKNWYYNELTAVYWAWKNLKADAIGITYYRRHFTVRSVWERNIKGKWECVLNKKEAEQLMKESDIVVAKRRYYWIETNESHYNNGHDKREIPLMRTIIAEKCPEYIEAYDTMWNRRWAHMFNMFIMKREKFNEFCEWCFDIMFEFEKRVDMSEYNPKEKRAFIDERLLDVWLIKNQYSYKEVKVMYMEKQNWMKKIGLFFLRKFFLHHNVWE